jgi:4-hydroxybutyryl-CoA dehydratase/vinylacetyl-CoA-Delta-isomerase
MIVFDNVFVPWERVFLAGEWQFSRLYATSFARYHRLTAATYKHVELQYVAGLARLMAEYNGLTHAPRIQDQLAWLAQYVDVTEALGKAAALDPVIDSETGFAIPNPVYTNSAKYWYASQWHEAMKYVQDITGGIAATIPSMEEWENPETRPYMEKYLQGDAEFPAEDRIKAINGVIKMGSTFGGVLAIHAEGSLSTQRMVIYQMADWDKYKAVAKRALGIPAPWGFHSTIRSSTRCRPNHRGRWRRTDYFVGATDGWTIFGVPPMVQNVIPRPTSGSEVSRGLRPGRSRVRSCLRLRSG